ncbi:hypothetical protein [Mycobacterium tilburgii]|uniref:hypothetical protein n=1 Tax=Mycobacterium tilburgii TaxID=44467 RepID=UPI001183CE55|nr:hypothetical protein [Mycobacterium tilburgii]
MRGEVEPYLTVARELARRGRGVTLAVAPEMIEFVESVGLAAVAYGPDLAAILEPHHDYWNFFFCNPWRLRELDRRWRVLAQPLAHCSGDVVKTLKSLADGPT